MADQYTWENLIDDLSYLVDEIQALKPLVDVVPLYENPGNELSIEERLHLIDRIQLEVLAGNQADYDQISSEIRLKREERGDVTVESTLNSLLSNREKLLHSLSESSLTLNRLSDLVVFERSQLRIIAEYILTITSDK